MESVTVTALVRASREKAWTYFTSPEHITKWNFASDDWHCPHATNDLRVEGSFSSRMEAKDGGAGFDFEGTYDEVVPNERLTYAFGGRHATVTFATDGQQTKVTTVFEPETENPVDMQRYGWQAILDNFKKHIESA